MTTANKSHGASQLCPSSVGQRVADLRKKIIQRGDLSHVDVDEQLHVLEQLQAFDLGRFVLLHNGANAYWTDYMLNFPDQVEAGHIDMATISPLEEYFVLRCPIILAHRERFNIYRRLAQSMLCTSCVMASIPCGTMRDLLGLDFSNTEHYQLVGIDIDPEALALAQALAQHHTQDHVRFSCQDAWQLTDKESFDVISSSGLNVYEADRSKTIALYQHFRGALTSHGALITSVLSYPPGMDRPSDWLLEKIPAADLRLNRIIHHDILEVAWRNFRSMDEITDDFIHAGFRHVEIHPDPYHIFPTVVARR